MGVPKSQNRKNKQTTSDIQQKRRHPDWDCRSTKLRMKSRPPFDPPSSKLKLWGGRCKGTITSNQKASSWISDSTLELGERGSFLLYYRLGLWVWGSTSVATGSRLDPQGLDFVGTSTVPLASTTAATRSNYCTTTSYSLPTADCRLPTADCRLLTIEY